MSNELKIYDLTHRETGEKRTIAGINAQDACQQAGWAIGDCYVYEQKPRRKPIPDHESLILVKIPCLTCSYQYSECRLPPGEQCPCRPDTPELNEWLKQVAKAHLCPHVGKELAKVDYNLRQKWETIEQAIKELRAQRPPFPANR